MVQDPTQFDVLVMPNLYGDILRSVYSIHLFWSLNSFSELISARSEDADSSDVVFQWSMCRSDRRTWSHSQWEHRSKRSRHIWIGLFLFVSVHSCRVYFISATYYQQPMRRFIEDLAHSVKCHELWFKTECQVWANRMMEDWCHQLFKWNDSFSMTNSCCSDMLVIQVFVCLFLFLFFKHKTKSLKIGWRNSEISAE